MANRSFAPFSWSLEKNPATLYAKVAIGGTGAPTLDGINSKGIRSITRLSAGKYSILFGVSSSIAPRTDTYKAIFMAKCRVKNVTAPAAPYMYVISQDVLNGALVVQFLAANGTSATDPGSGEELWLKFALKTSTAT